MQLYSLHLLERDKLSSSDLAKLVPAQLLAVTTMLYVMLDGRVTVYVVLLVRMVRVRMVRERKGGGGEGEVMVRV